MKRQHVDYKMVTYPKMRRLEAIAYRSVQHKPMIHGLIEVDVTRARAFLCEHKATTGESLSFTAFLITCLAKAVDEYKAVQAYRQGSKHLILFDDVDVYTPIERDGSTFHPPAERVGRERLWSFRLHGPVGAGRSGRRVTTDGGGHVSSPAMRAERKRLLAAFHVC
jgi:pyruvate/2-oxoglutarate dehydrogenase complex dihydrolipoamide acyltransferase (E2) component